jgi:hypothetical protein
LIVVQVNSNWYGVSFLRCIKSCFYFIEHHALTHIISLSLSLSLSLSRSHRQTDTHTHTHSYAPQPAPSSYTNTHRYFFYRLFTNGGVNTYHLS